MKSPMPTAIANLSDSGTASITSSQPVATSTSAHQALDDATPIAAATT
jgi:hypothetical protein